MFARFKAWFKKVFGHTVLIEAPATKFEEPTGPTDGLPDANSKGRVRLGIIVGHTKDAPGARMVYPHSKYEYEFNTTVANKVKELSSKYPNTQVEIIFRDGVGIAGAYAEARKRLCDAVIELHFNQYDGKVVGTETLTTPDASDVDFAHIIHKQICNVFNRVGESRGVKAISKSVTGGGNVHSFPDGVNCLVEPFFGDHPKEAAYALAHVDAYAEALLLGVRIWARNVDLIS